MRRDRQAIYQELLVLRCRRGQKEALQELVERWEKRLFYYVRRLVATEEDAWDVLQQTWMKVLKGIRSLKDPASLATWLYRIARNTALSHWRVEYRDDSDGLPEVEAPEDDFRSEDAERVHHGLGQIPAAQREVLTLYFLQDLSIDQVAEVIGIPPGTVKSRLYHAKRALRAVLEQESGDHE